MWSFYRPITIGVVVSLFLGITACDEEKKPAEAAAKPTATPSATATEKAPKRMPEVSLHSKAVNVGSWRSLRR